ncbi:phosphotransferase [Curtobacterium flaccumfaciens pv. poinsettiae]|uniref:phosphotransferase enzyme family protein n=1 Tax=Curtobacterium poinsettiae TaxID=159612 RepID=UPI0021C8F3D8|nr:phosphotransferase [Curtobacterium flaccumfaciens]MCU0154652.1 phosphotransferase [Curtobacterium flaccumfaciens pv. poinsettiae]
MERITRADDRVHRPAGPWTPTVHRLLAHLHEQGFVAAPEPIALGDTLETVSFVPGVAGEYPWTEDIASEAALVTSARLLRQFHDAAASFPRSAEDDLWSQADRAPVETIVHGDFAPYNCVYDGIAAVGLIDFDTAHPGPRVWDVASAVYRFAPFTTGAVEGSTTPDLDERLARGGVLPRLRPRRPLPRGPRRDDDRFPGRPRHDDRARSRGRQPEVRQRPAARPRRPVPRRRRLPGARAAAITAAVA